MPDEGIKFAVLISRRDGGGLSHTVCELHGPAIFVGKVAEEGRALMNDHPC